MYLGRAVTVGMLRDGRVGGAYCLASRSFPGRQITTNGACAKVTLLKDANHEENDFVEYPCAISLRKYLVISNGTHSELIAHYLEQGMEPMPAINLVLALMGYERDGHGTPRIVGVVDREASLSWTGIVEKEQIAVLLNQVKPGVFHTVSTNDGSEGKLLDIALDARDEHDLARFASLDISGDRLDYVVASLGIISSKDGWSNFAITNW